LLLLRPEGEAMKTRSMVAGLVLAVGLLFGASRTSEAGWYHSYGPRAYGYYSYAPAYAYRPYVYRPYVYQPYYTSYYYAPRPYYSRPYYRRPYYRPHYGFGFRFGW
jgi:hypothetical protein